MDNASIKENICKKRNEEGLSQEEMARKIGVVRNTYRKIEKGSVRLLSEHLDSIAEALGTSPEELVLGYKPMDGSEELEELQASYENRCRSLTDTYEGIIAQLKEELKAKDNEIRDLRSTIEDKNEIIALLKRKPEK
ncbi:MAG: helix-turn-helix domain-containing protein [Candidatus Cryptobacteroides sp.]